MNEIIEVLGSQIRVGDIICGTPWSKPEDRNYPTKATWTPHMTVTASDEGAEGSGWYHWETTTIYGGYVDEMQVWQHDVFHVVARSTGDALIGRGK